MQLHKLGIKVYAGESDGISLLDFIPVFHRWIQDKALDELLIDVADYSHVFAGPGTMLIAHEGNYGFDESDQRRGLVYYSKHELDGDLHARLRTVGRRVLHACRLLEQEPVWENRLRFNAGEIQVFSNDRLAAPNSDAGYAALESGLGTFLDGLYGADAYRLQREADLKARLAVNVTANNPVTAADLLARL